MKVSGERRARSPTPLTPPRNKNARFPDSPGVIVSALRDLPCSSRHLTPISCAACSNETKEGTDRELAGGERGDLRLTVGKQPQKLCHHLAALACRVPRINSLVKVVRLDEALEVEAAVGAR